MKLKKYINDNIYIRNRKKPILSNTVLLEGAKGQGVDGHVLALLKTARIKGFQKVYVAVVDEKRDEVEQLLKKNKLDFIELISYNSSTYFKKLARSQYLINDTTFAPIFSKRAEQDYTIIWHGTPLKYLGKDVSLTNFGNVQNNFLAANRVFVSNNHTKDVIFDAYNLRGIAQTDVIVGPSPRNALLFTDATDVYGGEVTTAKNYVYLPTWRDGKSETYIEYLEEIDERLTANETMFVKLHPLAKKKAGLDFSKFKHVKPFPEVDLYQFITLMDVVITDYSSILFDVLNVNKPIVLFNYDKDAYYSSRGVYEGVVDLGLPECQDITNLMTMIRSTDHTDYSKLKELYTSCDHAAGHEEVIDYILGKTASENITVFNERNGKDNVVIFAGALWDNGISKSFFNFIEEFETSASNLILMIERGKIAKKHQYKLEKLQGDVTYIERHGGPVGTILEKLMIKYYTKSKEKRFLDKWVLSFVKNVYAREFERVFSPLEIDQFIHFTGFDATVGLLSIGGTAYERNKVQTTIFCHTDMVEEYKKKRNFNKKIIYTTYELVDHIAVVNRMIGESLAAEVSGTKDKIKVATNFIGNELVSEMAQNSLFSDIRTKKITLGSIMPESIVQGIASETNVGKGNFVNDVIGTRKEDFPFLAAHLPMISQENSQVFVEGIELSYQFEHLPYVYGYTKMSLLEDLLNPAITVFTYVGRYSPEKGLERILYSFEKVYELNPNVRLVMISPHGATKKVVLAAIRQSMAREAIFVFDGMDNPYNVIAHSDALILSSYYEGLGLVALEAIASSVPVITTDLPELTRILNVSGHLDKPMQQPDYGFNDEEYQAYLTAHRLKSERFSDDQEATYPIKYVGEAIVVENSCRGVFFGLKYFVEFRAKETTNFNFDLLRDVSQTEYNQFIK